MHRIVTGLLLAAFAAAPLHAQVSGIGYRLSPSGGYLLYEGDAALEDNLMYGGALGLSFGEFVELGGLYLTGETETDFSDLSDVDDEALQMAFEGLTPRDVTVERYGGELKLNLARGAFAPFLTGGAGLVRFSPDGRDATRSIYLSGGVGLQLTGADRFGLSIQADALAYRFNPGRAFLTGDDLAALGLTYDDFQETEVFNPSLRAALQVYLGGRRPGELSEIDRAYLRQFSGGLSGLSFQLTPSYTRVDFDDALPYRDQSFAGGEVGFDIGPLVGLRGFYARGIESDDPTNFQDVQMYGGLGRFRLASGGGLVPFITLGGGYLDFLDGYAEGAEDDPSDDLAAQPDDRPFALGGVGVELPLSSRFVLSGEARAIGLSAQDLENVNDPDDVTFSPSYRAGVTFGLGGSAGRRIDVVTEAQARAELESELAAQRDLFEAEERRREAEVEARIARARAAGDSAAVARLRAQAEVERAEAEVRRAQVDVDAAAARTDASPGTVTPVRTPQGERIVTIPLPETGELYVRYGDPGGVDIVSDGTDAPASGAASTAPRARAGMTDAELRTLVRDALQQAMAEQAAQPTPGETDDERIRRLEDRIEQLLLLGAGNNSADTNVGANALLIQRIEERLEDRIDEQFESLRREIALAQRADRQPIVVREDGTVTQPVTPVDSPIVETSEYVEPGATRIGPTLGVGFGDASTAFVGLRVGYTGGPFSGVRYAPELLLGVGGDSFFALNFDGAFDIPTGFNVGGYDATPYVKLGVGVLNYSSDGDGEDDGDSGTNAVLNLGLGTDFVLGGGRVFAEATTSNFGDFNRLQAGYRFTFGGY